MTIATPRAYVQAVSGLYLTRKKYAGLTSKQKDIIAKLIEHSDNGVITVTTRREVMKQLGLKPQNFYNAMVDLKSKQAIIGNELHKIFTSNMITIKNAYNTTIG